MSFKREGDDSSQLNILKKRRVADLLSNFIPEDEAALIKNGRYTCLVCSYRPVFDTVDMLTVHRKGKKHLEGLKWFYGKKKNFQNEVEKRRHQDYVQAEEHSQGTTSSAPLLSQTRRITHHALLKSIPYNSCHKTTSTKSEKGSASFGPDCNTNRPSNAPSLWYQMPPVETVGGSDEETKSTSRDCNMAVHQRGKSSEKGKEVDQKKSQPPVSSGPQSMTVQRRRELEHYLKLKSSGWVQDNGGNWIKDENVEFDSDEDQPAPLSPSCGLPGVLDQEEL